MPYCTVAQAKEVLQIAELTWDLELEGCVASGGALVDSLLAAKGLSVPNPVPQNLIDATSHFAAWEYRRRRDPAGAEAFWAEANKYVETYIQGLGQSETEPVFKVCQD